MVYSVIKITLQIDANFLSLNGNIQDHTDTDCISSHYKK